MRGLDNAVSCAKPDSFASLLLAGACVLLQLLDIVQLLAYRFNLITTRLKMLNKSDIDAVSSNYTKSVQDKKGFETLCNFLNANTELVGWRGKNKPNLQNIAGLTALGNKYFTSKFSKVTPKIPKTVPDEMASVILNKFYNYPKISLKKIQTEHQHSMAAENMVGELLERYIDSVLSSHGWVWCCESLVKHVDFIKYEATGYKLLQIKNRDNSENSSSKAIRNGTTIEHWFRTFSKTGSTNWNSFPDTTVKSKLSEDDFIKFVEDYI